MKSRLWQSYVKQNLKRLQEDSCYWFSFCVFIFVMLTLTNLKTSWENQFLKNKIIKLSSVQVGISNKIITWSLIYVAFCTDRRKPEIGAGGYALPLSDNFKGFSTSCHMRICTQYMYAYPWRDREWKFIFDINNLAWIRLNMTPNAKNVQPVCKVIPEILFDFWNRTPPQWLLLIVLSTSTS